MGDGFDKLAAGRGERADERAGSRRRAASGGWWAANFTSAPEEVKNGSMQTANLSSLFPDVSPSDTAPASRPAKPRSPRWWQRPGGIVVVLILLVVGAGAVLRTRLRAGSPSESSIGGRRTLVIIVPGTWGNTAFWGNIIDGKATFASELRRAIGGETDIYPFLWASSIYHSAREEAAVNLANDLRTKAGAYDRIVIVAHSHGGNVALRAAGLADVKIDAIICLSTPHLYLVTIGSASQSLNLPIYCSPSALKNVDTLVNIWPSTDQVPEGWANWETGLLDNEAIAMTSQWRESVGHPRLADDGGLLRFAKAGRKVASSTLGVEGVQNVVIHSMVPDDYGRGAHRAIHSRRIGAVLGGLLRDSVSAEQIQYLQTLVQPRDTDDGEPVDEAAQDHWNEQWAGAFDSVGWRLKRMTVRFDPVAATWDKDTDGSLPDPVIDLQIEGSAQRRTSTVAANRLTAQWSLDWVLLNDTRYLITVSDQDVTVKEHAAAQQLDLKQEPPRSVPNDPEHGVFWTADFDWEPAHY